MSAKAGEQGALPILTRSSSLDAPARVRVEELNAALAVFEAIADPQGVASAND